MLPKQAQECLNLLKAKGYQAFVVGGLVRNILAGKDSAQDDIDIVTNAPLEEIEKIFNVERHLHVPDLCRFKFDGRSCDVLHVEGISADDENSLVQDAYRRDFTINALYVDADGRRYDPTRRGLSHLKDPANQLQSIIDVNASFEEDPFRVLRYFHLKSKDFTGVYPAALLRSALQPISDMLRQYQQNKEHDKKQALLQRFDSMLCKIFMNGNAQNAMHILAPAGFFKIFFPHSSDSNNQHSAMWLAAQFENLDAMSSSYAKWIHFYSIMMVLTLRVQTDDVLSRMNKKLMQFPFPTVMNWKMDPVHIESMLAEKKVRLNLYKSVDAIQKRHASAAPTCRFFQPLTIASHAAQLAANGRRPHLHHHKKRAA
jgi:tRNA nucleotidyltransferase/poly(A) polymerase